MKNILLFLIFSWFLLACLSPDIRGSFPISFRLEDLILLIMSILLLMQHVFRKNNFYVSKLLIISIFFLLFLICLSSISLLLAMFFDVDVPSAGYSGGAASVDMLKEFLRYSKYILIIFVFSRIRLDIQHNVIVVLTVCCFFIIAIQIMQYMQVPGLNAMIILIYGADDEKFVSYATDWAIELGQFRSGSIFGNPNVLGAFLITPFILLFMLTAESLKTNSISLTKRTLLFSMTCFVSLGLFLAQSRSALLACVAGVFVSLIVVRRYVNLRLLSIVKFGLIAFFLFGTLLAIFSDSMNRYTLTRLEAGFGAESMGVKNDLIFVEIGDLNNWQLIVGKGPALSNMLDSELGYIISWYGLAGLVGYYLFFYLIYREVKYRIKNCYVKSAFVGIIIAYLLLGIPSSGLLNIRVFPMFLALLSLAIASSRNIVAVEEVDAICS